MFIKNRNTSISNVFRYNDISGHDKESTIKTMSRILMNYKLNASYKLVCLFPPKRDIGNAMANYYSYGRIEFEHQSVSNSDFNSVIKTIVHEISHYFQDYGKTTLPDNVCKNCIKHYLTIDEDNELY
ncbi:MAG: hypothetical protein LBL75_00830 [Rickettsiales bacterium]|nr:hypothetical protein [Rickettsiales bacterium]